MAVVIKFLNSPLYKRNKQKNIKAKFKKAPLSKPQYIEILDNNPINTRLIKILLSFNTFQIEIINKISGISR